ncbi:MAG: hypothetical protein A3B37_03590 [Candidatus Sungbacteria bacterium RIFCSPLOWO2_01_FULL_59_16]|uniref:UDP-N-acetylmuramoyl-tripeptide--D-alanyl-D-alanine ligase n=1 Tax=Candidatus Sungbacteria bacterium RIFCSPLOWO2_01_FULL_59_16 TaxID=1802280 RepID=A0A1G2LE05_9BACT|nr:MAG: hypothetical protein A3B37_03590 [Candidatus Sungbacteria bacterium RIFCSPLOWO2_01_FULL_59_16]
MKRTLASILRLLARAMLRRYRPKIVGVTGSVGKTSAKEAIFTVLQTKFRVRRSEKNYNTEIGVPLAILGIPHCGRNIFTWAFAFFRVAVRMLIRDRRYPEILVLEMGADRPGDIAYLTKLAPPDVGVITAIGEIPVHVEFFAGPKELALEKSKLIEALPPEGCAVLNFDDAAIVNIRSRTAGRVLSYGFGEGAAIRVANYALDPHGIRFTLERGGRSAAVKLGSTFGRQQAYAAAAAAGVGIAFNMGLEEIAAALGRYESPPGRLKLIRGIKGTMILDDTYNASPAATNAALEVLRELPAERRIAVLGDMLELGEFTEAAHRAAGGEAARSADVFIAVGERMKFAMNAAKTRVETFWFAAADEAGRKLQELLKPGDVALIKGSQAIRMERVVKEVMAEPERAPELLIRQDAEWQKRP